MSDTSVKDKWDNIYSSDYVSKGKPNPTDVLSENACLLPELGTALDLASGLGGNAIFLADHGLTTSAWDISQQANNRLQTFCVENSIQILIETRDVEKDPPLANTFDVVCVSNFLERSITKQIADALKQDGLLFYQTYTIEKVSDDGPSNSSYRLQQNELLQMFSPLHILVYKEYGCVGKQKLGLRNVAQLVAQKR